MSKSNASKKAFDAPRDTSWMMDPDELIIVGLDTKDGPEHELYDKRALLPLDEDFAKNVDVLGIINPVTITKIAGKPYVVAGRQRVKAARLAKKWQKARGDEFTIRVPCRNRTGSTLMDVMIAENEARIDDDIILKAEKAQRMLDRGRSLDDLAVIFKVKSKKTIQGWLAVATAAPEVKKAVIAGQITASAGGTIAKLDGREAQVEELEKVITESGGKSTTKAAKKAVASRRSNGASDGVGLGKKEQKKLLDYASGTELNDKEPYWDGVRDALAAALGKKDQIGDKRMHKALKELIAS
jgi:ParB-like chromosome segregation protein Spo0J